MSVAKPTLVIVAAWLPSKGEADTLAANLAVDALAGDEEGEGAAVAVASATLVGEDLDLPGMARLLRRLGLDGVIPE